jgi:hypothetical protein
MATGPSSSQSSYLLPVAEGTNFTSIFTVGDTTGGGYKMVGIPDGLGAFDNGNGTFTVLMNHEISSANGVIRAHGTIGAFVSKWVINKSDLSVVSGSDLIQDVFAWNPALNGGLGGYNPADTPLVTFSRFCSADLAPVSAFFNSATGLGTTERIFLNGEETGAEGRAFGHIATGANAGKTYELPYLGKFSWENAVASPVASNKTIVAGTDDATPGQVYFYVGTKTNVGTEVDRAGLNNGKLFGIAVPGLTTESNATNLAIGTRFGLADLGFVQNKTGATLNTESNAASVTNFLRPEDGAWDPSNPRDFYFVTTNSFNNPSRLWRLRFDDATNPELGGTIEAVLNGTEGQQMLDNIGFNKSGQIILQEDIGNQAPSGKIWQYDIATDKLTQIGKHDPARFGDTGVAATAPFNQDEESSGVIDVQDILGPGMYLLDVQAHYNIPGELVQGGQLLAMYNPTTPSVSSSGVTSIPSGGSNLILGNNLANAIVGGATNDTMYGYAGADQAYGGVGNDYIDGGLDNDTLSGQQGNDTLLGGAGNDSLVGGSGIDSLIGGAGSNTFAYYATSDGADVIVDFDSISDKIGIKAFGFGLAVGGTPVLNTSVSGTGAQFIYSGGVLSFDSNGTNAGGSSILATLTGSPVLTTSNFVLF